MDQSSALNSAVLVSESSLYISNFILLVAIGTDHLGFSATSLGIENARKRKGREMAVETRGL